MNKANIRYQTMASPRARQRGIITTLTGVLVLVLLGLMMFFAVRVGVFDQRVSANDARQKLAFHTAESGIHHAKEFFFANGALLVSDQVDVLSDGSDGWFATTSDKRWLKCSEAGLDLTNGHGDHPCFGEPNPDQRSSIYYYYDSADDSSLDAAVRKLPLNIGDLIPATEAVTVEALMCMLELDVDAAVPVQGCSTDRAIADGSYFMITILARGQADCDGGVCNAEALVSERVSNFGATAGGNSPDVPLTTKSSFPPSGTAEVVPNPNAGGIGVPVSVWMNNNSSCGAAVVDPSSGSWATCEMHEWYGVDKKPDDMACSGTCSCTQAESISYTDANTNILGIDLVSDDDFPCDLFQFYFGIPRSDYLTIKGFAQIISNCDSLGPDSFGFYWVTGAECRVNSNTTIGSPDYPVLLVSATTLTRFNGGAKLYGVLFITDVEDATAEFQSVGTNTIYGSVINDAILGSYQGTFQVVWAEDVAEKAGNSPGLGSVIGGWSDFHKDWE